MVLQCCVATGSGSHATKFFYLPDFWNVAFFTTDHIWFKRWFFQNPLAQLAVLLAPSHWAVGYVEPCGLFKTWFAFLGLFYITMMSWWVRWHLKSPASPFFVQPFVEAQIKENINAASLAFVRGIHQWFPSQRASNVENVSIWSCLR